MPGETPRPPPERPAPPRSLCHDCVHVQIVTSGRGSTFFLCKVAREDPRFAKYPPQPVVACPRHAR